MYQFYSEDVVTQSRLVNALIPGIVPDIPPRQFVNLTRVRLRAPVFLTEAAVLQIEAEASAEYDSHSIPTLTGTVSDRRQLADLSLRTTAQGHWKGMALIDRLYVRFDIAGVDILAGRQRIAWGVGRVWSPTDLFNPLNPAVLGKFEKDGADAVLARVTFGAFSDVSFVLNGGRNPSRLNAGFRVRELVSEAALSAVGAFFDDRLVAGGDITIDVFDAGVRLEGIVSYGKRGISSAETYSNIVVGIDNQFTSRLYGMVEYFYNGRGETDRSRYLSLLLLLQDGELLGLGRHLLALQASYLVHPLATVSLTAVRNLDDESMMLSPQVLWSATDNISVSLGGQYFTGGRFSEYWWYPRTIFGRADLFF
jgi:hypothetical protein